MSIIQIVVLAVVQGVTEFLPISSSAHLVLVPQLMHWPDQGLLIDVAAHVGTLLAVLIYFRRDVAAMVVGTAGLLAGRRSGEARLAGLVLIATLPIVLAGYLALALDYAGALRSPLLIACTSILFGLVLWLVDRRCRAQRALERLGWGGALVVGLAQVLALLPGTSRAGITMTAGRLLGLDRTEAARFSMLLSIPTILAAGTLGAVELQRADQAAFTGAALATAALSCVAALISIALLMRWLRHASFTPFVIYRVLLGLAILGWLYL